MAARQVLIEATARIRGASDVGTVQSSLADAAAELLHKEAQLPLLDAHYARFMDLVIGRVLPDWVPCMPSWQRARCFDIWFDGSRISRHHVLLSIGRALSEAADPSACMPLLCTLFWCGEPNSPAAHSSGLGQILVWANGELAAGRGPQACVEPVLTLLCSLPERIANILRDKSPGWAAPPVYHTAVAEVMWAAHSTAKRDEDTLVLRALFEKQARCRRAGILMRVWMPHMLEAIDRDPAAEIVSRMGTIMEGLGESSFEHTFRELLASLPPFHVDCATAPAGPRCLLRRLFAAGLGSKPLWRYLMSQKLPVDQQLQRHPAGRHSVRYLLDLVASVSCSSDRPPCENSAATRADLAVARPIEEATGAVVALWSDSEFVARSTLEYHRHLTHTMLFCFDLLDTSGICSSTLATCLESRGWVGDLMCGVQHRFDSVTTSVRTFGMLVAERLSSILTPNTPLQFDDIQQRARAGSFDVNYFKDRSPPALEAERTEVCAVEQAGPAGPASQLTERAVVWDDPDLVLPCVHDGSDSCSDGDGSDCSSTSSSESVQSFEPYSGASNLQQGLNPRQRPPRHVRELLDWLRLPKDPKSVDYEKYETALSDAEQLLGKVNESTAEALRDEGVELVTLLLHLQNSLADGHETIFASQRHRAMVMAITQAPSLLLQHVASTAFAPNLSIAARLDCLDVLHDASNELSKCSGFAEKKTTVASDTIERAGISRRWGHTARASRSTSEVARPNHFAPHAAKLLFALLAEYQRPDEVVANLRTEPVFLAKLLRCLGMVLQCARRTLEVPRMARRLGEFCWHLRLHPDASVRCGVLLVFARVMHAGCCEEAVAREDLVEWLEDALLEEADTTAREIAQSMLSAMAS